jgi:uncharacterized membrane protein YbaN (DUF454 family)
VTGFVRKVIDWIVGLTLIAIGIIGGFIPLLPGWVFVFAGLAVLSSHSRLAQRIHLRMKERGRQLAGWIQTRKRPDQR